LSENRPPEPSRHMPWVGGLILIALGLIFLAQNFGGFALNNWWALFILIPACGSFATAWRIYQTNGRKWTGAVTGPLTGGLILTAVSGIFLFGLDIGRLWPVFLILAGLGALTGAMTRR